MKAVPKGARAVKAAALLLATAALVIAAVLLLLPRPKAVGEAETFPCTWENGKESEETLFSALPCLAGATKEGVLLVREGERGLVAGSSALQTVIPVLQGGTLAELLTLDGDALTPLESYAVQTFYGDRAYYEGEPFAWEGTRVWRTGRSAFSEVVLLGGSFEGDFLFLSGANTLYLTAEGEVGEHELLESALTRVVAEPPYFFRDGALWEEKLGIERFVALLPPGCTYEVADFEQLFP